MRIMSILAAAAGALVSFAACAEPVKITNIGHGYFSAALYIAKQEKIFEKYGLEPASLPDRRAWKGRQWPP